ncbi:hypothetical protein OROMI_000379 [Orobanche minor]
MMAMGRKMERVSMASLLVVCFNLILLQLKDIYAINTEGTALLAFKGNLTNSTALTNWNEGDTNPCGWAGVWCDNKGNTTIKLNFHDLNISGPIVSESLGKLTNLISLWYVQNISGEIPNDFLPGSVSQPFNSQSASRIDRHYTQDCTCGYDEQPQSDRQLHYNDMHLQG